jgi:hypothetical protein
MSGRHFTVESKVGEDVVKGRIRGVFIHLVIHP